MSIDALRVRFKIQDCRRCATFKEGKGPIPMELQLGGLDAVVAVVVPEPTNSEIKMGRLYMDSPGAKLMRASLATFFSERQLAFVPVQACKGSSAHCREWFEAQLSALKQLKAVILPGKEGMDCWRPDLTLSQYQGHMGMMLDRYPVFPTIHPDTVKRKIKPVSVLMEHIQEAVHFIEGDLTPEFLWNYNCPVKGCGFEGEHMDPDNIWYCDRHKNSDHFKKWKVMRRTWEQERNQAGQIRLWD